MKIMNVLYNSQCTKNNQTIRMNICHKKQGVLDTIVENASKVPPRATFKASTDAKGPIMNVVPVSTIAYKDELIAVVST